MVALIQLEVFICCLWFSTYTVHILWYHSVFKHITNHTHPLYGVLWPRTLSRARRSLLDQPGLKVICKVKWIFPALADIRSGLAVWRSAQVAECCMSSLVNLTLLYFTLNLHHYTLRYDSILISIHLSAIDNGSGSSTGYTKVKDQTVLDKKKIMAAIPLSTFL